MRQMTRMGLDELRRSFPLLTASMQSQIVGGLGVSCAIDAIFLAAKQINCCVSHDAVNDKIVDIFIASNPGCKNWDRAKILEWVTEVSGLTNTQTDTLWRDVFVDYESGGNYNTQNSATMVAYAIPDKEENDLDHAPKMETTHAGIIVRSERRNGVDGYIIKSKEITEWVSTDKIRKTFTVYGVNDAYQCGDEGGSGI